MILLRFVFAQVYNLGVYFNTINLGFLFAGKWGKYMHLHGIQTP